MRTLVRLGLVTTLAASTFLAAGSVMAAETTGHSAATGVNAKYVILTLDQAAPTIQTTEDPAAGRHGDASFFEAGLSRHGKPFGSLSGTIVINDVTADNVGEEIRLRTLVFALPAGQIVAIGTSRYQLPLAASVPVLRAAATTAIVGGTGIYSGARGQVKTVRHPDGTYTQVLMLLK